MKSRPLQLETSLYQNEHQPHDTFFGQYWTTSNAGNAQDAYFEAAMNSAQFPGALHDSISHQYVETNASNQSHASNIGFDTEGSISHDQYASGFANQSQSGLIPGFENSAEWSSSNGPEQDEERMGEDIHCSPYNAHRTSVSLAGASTISALPFSYPPDNSAPQAKFPTTMYSPFRGQFAGSQDAKCYRHGNTRFGRIPYIPPETDPSIALIESSRHIHVERIYNAMTRGDIARDNPSSIAMKRWVHAAHYAPDLVEAYAHKVFDCLLLQAKLGFRGWHHNDYVADERKGEDDDRGVDCAGRLDNIIAALEQEKTICEDVMNSACQIRMFVNAPRAYSNRKYQNRIGNSKRGKAKDGGEGNSRPSKTRKTRARSGTGMSDLSGSRHTTPQPQLSLPYFSTPITQCLALSPLANTTHRLPAMTQSPAPQQRQQQQHTSFSPTTFPNKVSISPSIPPPTPWTTTIPPLHSPFLSPPPLSQTYFSTPPKTTTNNAPLSSPFCSPWSPPSTNLPQPPFFTQDWTPNWAHSPPTRPDTSPDADTNLFAAYDADVGLNLADVNFSLCGEGSGVEFADFHAFWMGQKGVQEFPGGR